MIEIYKDIEGYEGYYQISNLGNVKSLITNKLIACDCNNMGYKRVTLYKPKRKRFFVHRLVAYYFCNGYEEGLVVNHIDGNKQNNIYTNLEWCTHSENDLHAYEKGLRIVNNARRVAKYDLEGNKLAEYNTLKEASEMNNTSDVGIRLVCQGKYKQWKVYTYKYI